MTQRGKEWPAPMLLKASCAGQIVLALLEDASERTDNVQRYHYGLRS